MRALLWKVFPPPEVKCTIEEIHAFMETYTETSVPLCAPIILRDTVRLARDAEKTVYAIRIKGMKPDQLALVLISNVLARHISSGQNHTYRGALSMIGDDMLTLWSAAVAALKERGYCSDAEAEEDMRWIREQIQNAG